MATRQITTFIPIDSRDILGIASEKLAADWRFLEVHANRPYKNDKVEIMWSFIDDVTQKVESYEAFVDPGASVDSLSHLYPCAFMFENEMHDLYGIDVRNLSLDYQGSFYRLRIDSPMMDKDVDKPFRNAPATTGDDASPTGSEAGQKEPANTSDAIDAISSASQA
jgi:hypothetical protein